MTSLRRSSVSKRMRSASCTASRRPPSIRGPRGAGGAEHDLARPKWTRPPRYTGTPGSIRPSARGCMDTRSRSHRGGDDLRAVFKARGMLVWYVISASFSLDQNENASLTEAFRRSPACVADTGAAQPVAGEEMTDCKGVQRDRRGLFGALAGLRTWM